ncbi:c-type cytochrome [Chthoniobacter flavus]|uniref:c-type cytochrome n=1 Tax=Chthoniobacter flavus TaxID=191863 RepID=UPI0005B28EAF|nr:c-type cytochrome [Chthoniobacter flavus]
MFCALIIIVLLVVGGAFLYHYIVTGGLRARQKPSALEARVAASLVNFSIPTEFKAMKNPLDATPNGGDVAAGRELYQKNCDACHGFDGTGNTHAGNGTYPPPFDLSHAAIARRNRTDGELFYFIRNGVRNTAMPGWQMPNLQIWQLVAYIRNLPLTAPAPREQTVNPATPAPSEAGAHYVGSAACEKCHEDIYTRWKKTPMANVVRNPKEHPDAIIPDLKSGDPLITFTVDDIAFVYGSKWKQRYFKKVGDDYYVLPAQWDVTHKQWKPYFVKKDWWAEFYPPDNFQRPTGALCDGCHSVNYDIKTKIPSEWNVGCEKCHGPGSEHVKQATAASILCPSRMDYVAANDTCIQCHSQGRTLTNPIDGKYYDWPVGYDVSKKLSDYWKLEDHKLGETTFTHFPDGTAHKNRMQGNDFTTSLMYTHGVTCFTCHDVHGTEYPSQLRKPASSLCLDCHGPSSPNGPFAPSLEAHTHHKAGSAGSECIACHMPKIAETLGDVNVRSHTFHFVSPSETDSMKIPNACNVCHTDKTTAWATSALKSWGDQSPWRVAQ